MTRLRPELGQGMDEYVACQPFLPDGTMAHSLAAALLDDLEVRP